MAKKYVKKTQEELKSELSQLQYDVTQNSHTEKPFENEYFDHFEKGIYVDITTNQPLFLSTDKFESGCGWPAFARPINKQDIKEVTDLSFGMRRVEVRSELGDSHLGHVFNDGPKELGGVRYCINSASLRFIPYNKLKEEGYEEYIAILDKELSK